MLKPGFEKKIPEERETKESSELAASKKIRARIRFDYQGKARPSRFLFGRKSTEEAAEELREKQAALWQNVPVQGVYIEKIDLGRFIQFMMRNRMRKLLLLPWKWLSLPILRVIWCDLRCGRNSAA